MDPFRRSPDANLTGRTRTNKSVTWFAENGVRLCLVVAAEHTTADEQHIRQSYIYREQRTPIRRQCFDSFLIQLRYRAGGTGPVG